MLPSSRVLDIHINDVRYYGNLNVTPERATVFATIWPLGGPTKLTLSPATNSNTSPLTKVGRFLMFFGLEEELLQGKSFRRNEEQFAESST
ncbi:hypothetical protein DITRI_Ditri11bG0008400 [Diplodiscus trichospermus]